MHNGIDWLSKDLYASSEAMLLTTLAGEQLNNVLRWVQAYVHRCIYAISLPNELSAIPVHQKSGLTQTASIYDDETSKHVQRVMQLAVVVARQLAQREEEIHQLCLAAFFHDIGKIGIPAEILSKPEPLTQEEWSIIRCHPDIGRQVLEQAGGMFQQVANIVGAHHERWDGQGYPRGIAATNIPPLARILTVVDAYDAMTSQRAYQRNPCSITQARRELQRCASSQFDPWVVQAFLPLLEKHPAHVVRKRMQIYMRSPSLPRIYLNHPFVYPMLTI